MIELITLTVLVTIVIALIRPGTTPPLDNPLVIERSGQFHMTLAPQLNLAQPLIEAIASQLLNDSLLGDSETLCFEIRDADVAAHGQKFYLLGLTRRNGMLYFQAIGPRPQVPDTDRDTPYKVLLDYAAQVLVNIPSTPGDANLGVRLAQTVLAVAAARGINARQLPA